MRSKNRSKNFLAKRIYCFLEKVHSIFNDKDFSLDSLAFVRNDKINLVIKY